jgi:hypothetical protein
MKRLASDAALLARRKVSRDGRAGLNELAPQSRQGRCLTATEAVPRE